MVAKHTGNPVKWLPECISILMGAQRAAAGDDLANACQFAKYGTNEVGKGKVGVKNIGLCSSNDPIKPKSSTYERADSFSQWIGGIVSAIIHLYAVPP